MTNEQYYIENAKKFAESLSNITDISVISAILEEFRHFVSNYEMDKAQANMFNMTIVEYIDYMNNCMDENFNNL